MLLGAYIKRKGLIMGILEKASQYERAEITIVA